jgi:cell division protein FtsQ
VRLARRRVAIAVLALVSLGAGWLWFRDSSLVAATHVKIHGLSGTDSRPIRTALRNAASDMTTLHVRADALRTAVRPYPIVKDIRVQTDFPHGLRITVIEYDAVAAVTIDGVRVPVAADGTVLRGRPAAANLVTLSIPSANGGGRLTSRRGLSAVRVMGAAPHPLRRYVKGIDFGPDGLRVSLRNGPLLQFGDATRARAKWIAVARVLGDPRSAGASYLDVRIPERPVAGRFNDPGQEAPVDGTLPAAALSVTEDSTASQDSQSGTDATSTDSSSGADSQADGAGSTDSQATVEGQ